MRLRFFRPPKAVQVRFGLRSLFVFTGLAALLICLLAHLFPERRPLLPLTALIPPLVAICLLHAVAGNEVWKGVAIGAVFGIALIFIVNPPAYWVFPYSTSDYEKYGIFRYMREATCFWIFFELTTSPFVGGCIEAVRKGYVNLGMYMSLSLFVYYLVLYLNFAWAIMFVAVI